MAGIENLTVEHKIIYSTSRLITMSGNFTGMGTMVGKSNALWLERYRLSLAAEFHTGRMLISEHVSIVKM